VCRHILAASDLVFLDGRQHAFGIELLHDDNGAADLVHRHRPAERRSVVERCRRKIDAVGREAVKRHRNLDEAVGLVDRGIDGQRHANALGPPGRSRGIEHVDARTFIGDRGGRHRRNCVFPAPIAGNCTTQRIAFDVGRKLRGQRRQARRHHEQLRSGILQDIIGFIRRQPRRQAHIAQSGALRAPGQIIKGGRVFNHEGNHIFSLQSV